MEVGGIDTLGCEMMQLHIIINMDDQPMDYDSLLDLGGLTVIIVGF